MKEPVVHAGAGAGASVRGDAAFAFRQPAAGGGGEGGRAGRVGPWKGGSTVAAAQDERRAGDGGSGIDGCAGTCECAR